MNYRITYRQRRMITQFTCIDTERKITLLNAWEVGGLIYGYTDRFNVSCIAKEDIISMDKF